MCLYVGGCGLVVGAFSGYWGGLLFCLTGFRYLVSALGRGEVGEVYS